MNFFEQQDQARRKTKQLVVLVVVALIGLVAATYFLVIGILVAGSGQMAENDPSLARLGPGGFWNPELLAFISAAVGIVVGGGSVYKTLQLAGGGEPLALSLGGRRLLESSTDPLERKVLNVVEEMALASGLPVPPVYLMDHEPGINAFAAGYKPEEAVIGITRGCVEQLSREELQGVVAHEFSHILNGDARLNIRLIAIVHGILLVGLIGYYVFRMAASTNTRRRNDKDGGAFPFLVFGLGLMAVGFAGTLIGNLIKAAVSRQREFLADASAVQFTRNPDGIAGALKRIGGFTEGSRVSAARAPEASHMFFATGVFEWFATHPPLAERIRRIDLDWQADKHVTPEQLLAGAPGSSPAAVGFASGSAATPAIERTMPSPEQVVGAVGHLEPGSMARSRELLEAIPPILRRAASDPSGACAVIFTLLLDDDFETRERQFSHLATVAEPVVRQLTIKLQDITAALPQETRLPLVFVCLGPLKELSQAQYGRFREAIHALIAADDQRRFFEWAIQKVVYHVLDTHFEGRRKGRRPTSGDISTVLSAMAHASGGTDEVVRAAFDRGARAAGLDSVSLEPWDGTIALRLDQALDALGRLPAVSKERLLRGLAETASSDGAIQPRELELLRVVATTLDCPMPL